jgi:hypothetical protein
LREDSEEKEKEPLAPYVDSDEEKAAVSSRSLLLTGLNINVSLG